MRLRYSRPSPVDRLFGYYDDFWRDDIDAAMLLDEHIEELAEEGHLPEVAEELDRMVAAAPDSVAARNLLPSFILFEPFWEGPDDDYLGFLVAVRDRVHQALADPSVIPPSSPLKDGMTLPRTSRFVDQGTAEKACTLLVQKNYAALKHFEAGTNGWRSMHFYADLTDEIGTTGTVLVNDEEAGSQLGVTPGASVETGCAVMVISRDLDTGEVFVQTAHPELPLDETVRASFPALCHFYGPWFGQDRREPVWAMRDACSSTKEPAFSQVRNELDLLLSVVADDDEMRRVLEACGSYVLPQSVRHWVDRTRWRLDAFDWLPAQPITPWTSS